MTDLVSDRDSLDRLEERIQQAADVVSKLRRQLDSAVQEAAEARVLAARMSEELETLRGERTAVRTRIEKLLAQMDALSAG
jgi:FtsZ-binding cell division protein ZapB